MKNFLKIYMVIFFLIFNSSNLAFLYGDEDSEDDSQDIQEEQQLFDLIYSEDDWDASDEIVDETRGLETIKALRTVVADTIKPTTGLTLTTLTQNAKINKNLTVVGNETCSGTLTVAKATTIKSTLGVTGATNVKGNLTVNTSKFTANATTGNTTVAGTLGVKGNLAVNTNKFTANATTGNTAIAGTLGVVGVSTLGVLNTSGRATLNSLGVTNNATIGGTLEVAEAATLSKTLDVGGADISLVLKSIRSDAGCARSISWPPNGDFVVATDNGAGIRTYGVDNNGIISELISFQITDSAANAVAWSLQGDLIAVVNAIDNTVQIFGVDETGHLSSVISSKATGIQPFSVSWSPNGDFIVVVNMDSDSIQLFGVDVKHCQDMAQAFNTQGIIQDFLKITKPMI